MNFILDQLLSLRQIEYLVMNGEFNILETSSGVQRFADCPNEVIGGKDVRLGFPELVGVENILAAILQGQQKSFDLKGIGRSSDRSSPVYIDISIIKAPDEERGESKLIIFVEDVTQRMILEQKIVQMNNEVSLLLEAWSYSNDYLNKIITSMTNAVLVTSQSGIIKTVNLAVQDFFGYSGQELVGKPLSIFIKEEKLLLEASQQYLLSGNELKDVEIICKTKTGKEVAIAFSCSAIQTNLGDVQDFIYVGRKLTEC
jgi:PAS domain S-box-containing protein